LKTEQILICLPNDISFSKTHIKASFSIPW
jgi:hypothetical protein